MLRVVGGEKPRNVDTVDLIGKLVLAHAIQYALPSFIHDVVRARIRRGGADTARCGRWGVSVGSRCRRGTVAEGRLARSG